MNNSKSQKRKSTTHIALRYYMTDILQQQIKASGVTVSQLSKSSGISESMIYHLLKDGKLKFSNLCLLASTPEARNACQPQDLEFILNTLLYDSADENSYPQFDIRLLPPDHPALPYKSLPDFLHHLRVNVLGISIRHAAFMAERCSRTQIDNIEKKYLSIGPSVLYHCFESYYPYLPKHARNEYLTTFATLLMQRFIRSPYNYTFTLREWKQKY